MLDPVASPATILVAGVLTGVAVYLLGIALIDRTLLTSVLRDMTRRHAAPEDGVMSRRRVLVDAAIVKPNLGGLRTYIRSLVGALHDRDDVALDIITSRPGRVRSRPGRHAVLPAPAATQGFVARSAWREARLGRSAERTGADVVLVPYPEMTLRRLPVPSVMVVHDVRGVGGPPLRHPRPPAALRRRPRRRPAARRPTSSASASSPT